MDKDMILSRVQLFEKLSQGSREALADICLPKTFKKKEILFLEENKGYSVYILIRGNIQLFKTAPDGKEIVIKLVQPGEMFAEVILFEEDRYPVSALALTESQVFMIPKHQFSCLLENQIFRHEFIGSLMQKLRYLADQIKTLSNYDVEERLLMFIEKQWGKKERIKISLTKKDVAAAIGTTPETLSRLLLRLKKEGKLKWEGSYIDKL